ncbi:hypothetical protein ACI79C_13150 [Geodermatophilus sp. SYSU D00697]
MDPLTLAGVITALVGLIVSFFARRTSAAAQQQVHEALISTPEATLENRLEDLARTMRTSARLLAQVSAEMEARSARAAELKSQVEEAERLAQLSQEDREAVARLFRAELAGETKIVSAAQWRANWLFFLGGVLVSVRIQLFVTPIG